MRLKSTVSAALVMAVVLFADFGGADAREAKVNSSLGVGAACAGGFCLYQDSWNCTHISHDHYNYCPDGWCPR